MLVTALTPTKAGEGKTCTSVGLADGLCKIGKKGMASLREPSLGPVFGMKGGAAGGGYAQVVPMQDINLHFTGDLHAIGCAHNLLSAMVDNHIYWGNEPLLDSRQVKWGRVVDMNDRALRNVIVGLGSITDGFPRQDRFDITGTPWQRIPPLVLAFASAPCKRMPANAHPPGCMLPMCPHALRSRI